MSVDGAVTINESGNAVDFRVEGDSNSNLLLVDGSADRVGINTSSPDAKLDVEGTTDAEVRVTRTTASVSSNFADQGAVLNLVNNIQFENGYNGDAYTGQILFTSNDTSTGAGVRAKIAVKNTHYAHFERLMFHVSPQNTATGISTATGHDGKAVEIYKGSETTVFHIGDSTPLNIGTGYNEATLCVGKHFGIYSDNNGGVNTSEMMINCYNDGSNRVYATSGRHAQRVQFDTYNGNMHFSVSDSTGNADANVTFKNALSIANTSGNITTNSNGSLPTGSTKGFGFSADQFYTSTDSTSANTQVRFYNGNGLVGNITTNGSSTTFNTSSDYRLKENVTYNWDATSRLKQLKPARFNFKVDKDTTVDGFLAHEVSDIVPEAIGGVKDETQDLGTIKDKDGNVLQENVLETRKGEGQTWTKTKTENVYQGIDQSKLVPLLVKTIQELEARVTALEGK